MTRTKANVVFVVLHGTAVLLCLGGLPHLEQLISTGGSEGGWLDRIYVGILLWAGVLANAVVGGLALYRKRQSVPLTVLCMLAILPVVLAGLWILDYRARF